MTTLTAQTTQIYSVFILATPEQICTVGPSRPSELPLPICRVPMKNLATASRSRTVPPGTR